MAQTAVEWLEARVAERIYNNQMESPYWHLKQFIKDFEQAKQMEKKQKQNGLKIIEAQNQYIEVLRKEIDSAVCIAHIHGWRSNLVEEGENLRNEIALLNKSFNNFI